jgi:hypothetical protein
MTEPAGVVAYPLEDKPTEPVGVAELPDDIMYPLDDGPAGPDGIAELPEDAMYPLEDGPAELSPGDEAG